jgi:serine/threonine protein kinase
VSDDPTRTRLSEEPTRTRTTDTPTKAREIVEDPTATRERGDAAQIPATVTRHVRSAQASDPLAHLAPPVPSSADPLAHRVASSQGRDEVPFGEGYALRGRYVLETMIGKGAMGQVWKAKDLLAEKARDRNPYVAIKVLTSDYEQHPRAFEAMQREASRAQGLAHPNVVTVYTFDVDDRSGRVFIAMELLNGRPLDRLIRDSGGRGVAVEDAWKVIRGVAEGLAYAHRKGIVHSDLKPANIFLTADGVPKVLDFGIARAAKQAGDESGTNDDDSVMSGYTVTYAAPEVFDDAPPDTADDVFALGIVAYELLTGRHPFGREPANVARDRRAKPGAIKALSRRQWRAIAGALEFDRQKRLPDAAAFLRALQGVTPLQIGLAAAVVVLAVTATVLWYRGYLASRPAIAFEQLPLTEQQYVRHALDTGNEALELVRKSNVIEATADAADSFADAYEHHPRNPDAVAGLEEAADRFIEWIRTQPDHAVALRELRNFQQKSPYYARYAPLESAIEEQAAKP